MRAYIAGSVLFFLGSLLLFAQQTTAEGRLTCFIYAMGSVMFLVGTLRTKPE